MLDENEKIDEVDEADEADEDPETNRFDARLEQIQQQERARLELCERAVAEVLQKFGCEIISYLIQPEQVGNRGNKVLIECRFGIRALPQE